MPFRFKFQYIPLLLIGLLITTKSYCTNIDSLKSLISKNNDTTKINLLNNISREYYNASNYDSAIKYANLALKISEKEKYIKGQSIAYENLAEVYYDLEIFEKSIENYTKSIEAKQIIWDRKGEAYCLHVIGMLYRKMNNNDKAIDYEFRSLKIAEEINDKLRIAYVSNGIALIYQSLKQFNKSLQYYQRFLDICLELNDCADVADAYNNIGTVYIEMKVRDKALFYYKKSLQIYISTNYRKGLARSYSNIGNIFLLQGKLDSAIIYQDKGLHIEFESNNREGIAYSYSNIADIHFTKRNFDSAIIYKKRALDYTLENDLREGVYDDLTRCYILKSDSANAMKSHKLSLAFKDSIYNRETKNIIAELQTKYETDKKEKEIQILTKENEVKTLRLKSNQILLYSISGILILIVSLVFVILRAYRTKNKANLLLVQKNNEILNQKEEIEAQRDEIEIQRDTLAKQKKNITDSILYAQRIQQAVLPTPEVLKMALPEHFVLFKPRDIVSGDFYWLKRINNLVVFAVADCTGHGVPGAFMSMLGVSFLNEIVNDKGVNSAGEVLSRMREMVKSSLHQRGVIGEQKDGMDMALCVLNMETLQLQYAGAHNPLFIIRKGINLHDYKSIADIKSFESETHTLFEIKANRQSVSFNQKEVEFTTHEIQLKQGDSFYMFSDGIIDQLGGEANEKYRVQRFKKLLLDSVEKTMDEQKQILENTHELWRKNIEQIDDILVFGVRV